MIDDGLAQLGNNLAALAGAMASNAIMMVATGRRYTEGVLGIPPAQGHGHGMAVEHTCRGIVRHHYSCCCVPRCYGCGGCCR